MDQSLKNTQVMLLGKLPQESDYVRMRLNGNGVALDAWLQATVDDLRAAQRLLPPRVVRFAVKLADRDVLAVGVLTPSQDAMGRQFPITLFSEVPWRALQSQLSSIPTLFSDFLANLQTLLFELPALKMAEIQTRVAQTRPPNFGEEALKAARDQVRQILEQLPADRLFEHSLGSSDAVGASYAIQTIRSAVALHGKAGRFAGSGTVLCCDTQDMNDVVAWTDLLGRFSPSGQGFSGIFWHEQTEGPMLLCLGSAPVQALRFVSDLGQLSNHLWPLTSAVPEARELAFQAIGVELERRLQQGASVGATWQAMTKAGSHHV